ncbi:hypothetical protein EBR66_01370 [bacterium]|nr:hypothetical protein [bacterium]
MQSRFMFLVLAGVTVLGVGAVLFQKGLLSPYHYEAPLSPATPVSEMPQTRGTLVSIVSPAASSSVSKTFVVSGVAPGYWSFEGSFPVQVRSSAQEVIATAVAQLEGDWMTDKQIPFSATIDLGTSTYQGPAMLILMKDNPSGLPENEDSVSMPLIIQY